MSDTCATELTGASPTLGVPYGAQLRLRAAMDPTGLALTVIDRQGVPSGSTWEQLDRGANQWGRMLGALGASVGSLVAIAVPNSLEFVLTALGCWKIGAVPVPMRWDLPQWERDRVLAAMEPTVVVDERQCADMVAAADLHDASPLPDTVSPRLNGICSSGSTGVPKVIVNAQPATWTPRHAEPFASHWGPVPRPQTILVPGPMYHTNGFIPLSYLLGGDRLVILEKFDASAVLDAIERHRITTFTATPTMLQRIADVPGVADRDFSAIAWIMQGAAPMPADLLRRWFDILGPHRIVMAYGMTENLGLTALRGDEWLTHPGSVGRGFRDTEIRILDATGSPVETGTVGEVYLRSPMSASYEYLGVNTTLPRTDDGFTSAGDIGCLDDDGYLYVIDRRSDMIVTGGANVFPAEVESALIAHPDIADVVVLGLRDQRWGRRVHAVVQPHATAPELSASDVIAFARSRLASYKVPKTVEFVDEIPRTAATKVSRSAMTAERDAR